ncbi:MAG: TIM barrel protein [Armatimonadetes bacterium]|nr:TIM barrel protein [Armatimonadota bacterium]
MASGNVSLGISWYSVIAAWRRGEMSAGRFIDFAKEVGADGVELLDAFLYEPGEVRDHLPHQAKVDHLLEETKEALARTGLKIHSISVTNDFNHDDTGRLILEREKIRLGIDLAKEIGASVVRVFSGNPTSTDSIDLVRYRTIDALKDLDDASVTLALENHGNVFATPSRLMSILEPLQGRNTGLCFDVGNFLLASVDAVEAARELPAPALIHVKDFRPAEPGVYRSNKGVGYDGCRLGEGVVPIEEALAVLIEKVGEKPIFIDLEMECGEDGVEATRAGMDWLRSKVEAL